MLGFGFNEEKMKEKLEDLHASVEKKPENYKKAEGILAVYQKKINKNKDKVKDMNDLKARIDAIKLAINKAKGRSKENKKAA